MSLKRLNAITRSKRAESAHGPRGETGGQSYFVFTAVPSWAVFRLGKYYAPYDFNKLPYFYEQRKSKSKAWDRSSKCWRASAGGRYWKATSGTTPSSRGRTACTSSGPRATASTISLTFPSAPIWRTPLWELLTWVFEITRNVYIYISCCAEAGGLEWM